jgi:methionyl-tRNA formyltransferase
METIYAAGGSLDLVITLPDDVAPTKAGRVFLDDFCESRGIGLLKVSNINDPAVVNAVADAGIDWLFVIGWSQIARRPVLDAPSAGVIGMHPTLLPEGRGRAAIPWAILKGLSVTGVTMFQLDEGVDTGPIIAQHEIRLGPDITATELYARVERAHSLLLAQTWYDLAADRLTPRPQDLRAGSSWPGRRPEDGQIFPEMAVEEALRLVRATTRPYPGAYWHDEGRILRVWAAAPRQAGSTRPTFQLADGVIEALAFDIEAAKPIAGPTLSVSTR